MSYLPPELLIQVCSHLSKRDLKQVRLVNSTWLSPATEFLFRRIYISSRSLDLDVFEEWTSNGRCSAATKEVVYVVSVMDPNMDPLNYTTLLWVFIDQCYAGLDLDFKGSDHFVQEIFHHIRSQSFLEPDQELGGLGSHNYNPNRSRDFFHQLNTAPAARLFENPLVTDGYNEYLKQANLEREAQENGEMLMTLSVGLQNLPNVSSIKLEHESWVAPWNRQEHLPVFNPVSLCPTSDQGSPFQRLLHPLYLPPYNCTNIILMQDGHPFDGTRPGVSAYRSVITAASSARQKISKLDVMSSKTVRNTSGFPILDLCTDPHATQLYASRFDRHVACAYDHLRSLSLNLACLRDSCQDQIRELQELRKCLRMTIYLKHLEVILQPCDFHEMTFIGILADDSLLPELRSLTAGGSTVTSNELSAALTPRRLQELQLNSVMIKKKIDVAESFERLPKRSCAFPT